MKSTELDGLHILDFKRIIDRNQYRSKTQGSGGIREIFFCILAENDVLPWYLEGQTSKLINYDLTEKTKHFLWHSHITLAKLKVFKIWK